LSSKIGILVTKEELMALYKDGNLVRKADAGLGAFDKEWKPGETPDHAGI
jgi:hypothetical protein